MTAKLAHTMVAHVAKELAATYYEEAAHDDVFYKAWPKMKVYVGKNWRHFVRPARAALAQMLGQDKWPEKVKEEIFEALLLDKSLPQGQGMTVMSAPSGLVH